MESNGEETTAGRQGGRLRRIRRHPHHGTSRHGIQEHITEQETKNGGGSTAVLLKPVTPPGPRAVHSGTGAGAHQVDHHRVRHEVAARDVLDGRARVSLQLQ